MYCVITSSCKPRASRPAHRNRSARKPASVVLAAVLLGWIVTLSTAQTAHADTWTWPLHPRPEVVNGFAPPDAPWGRGHRGVDLRAPSGQEVLSAGAGTVTYAGVLAGRGVVTISHGALRTTYEPVRASVQVGQELAAGQVVGELESDSSHCAPLACLHWGLLRGEEYLDPLGLLATGPPRLLPLHETQSRPAHLRSDRDSETDPRTFTTRSRGPGTASAGTPSPATSSPGTATPSPGTATPSPGTATPSPRRIGLEGSRPPPGKPGPERDTVQIAAPIVAGAAAALTSAVVLARRRG